MCVKWYQRFSSLVTPLLRSTAVSLNNINNNKVGKVVCTQELMSERQSGGGGLGQRGDGFGGYIEMNVIGITVKMETVTMDNLTEG